MVCCPLMGEIAINQLSAASKICIPEGSIFQGIAKGSGTRLFFEKNGKRALVGECLKRGFSGDWERGDKMKKIPMVIMMAAPYIFIGTCIGKGLGSEAFTMWKVLCVLVYLPNMVYAFILPKLHYGGKQLLFWSMILKLFNIPVYVLVILIVLLLHILILPLAPFLVLFDYTLLLPSSMYGISGIMASCAKGRMSKKAAVIHIIMQFMFCLDVLSAVYCYFKMRQSDCRR